MYAIWLFYCCDGLCVAGDVHCHPWELFSWFPSKSVKVFKVLRREVFRYSSFLGSSLFEADRGSSWNMEIARFAFHCRLCCAGRPGGKRLGVCVCVSGLAFVGVYVCYVSMLASWLASVWLPVCLSGCVRLCDSVCGRIHFSMSVYTCVIACVCVTESMCVCASLWVCAAVCVCTCVCLCTCVCASVLVPVCVWVCASVCVCFACQCV